MIRWVISLASTILYMACACCLLGSATCGMRAPQFALMFTRLDTVLWAGHIVLVAGVGMATFGWDEIARGDTREHCGPDAGGWEHAWIVLMLCGAAELAYAALTRSPARAMRLMWNAALAPTLFAFLYVFVQLARGYLGPDMIPAVLMAMYGGTFLSVYSPLADVMLDTMAADPAWCRTLLDVNGHDAKPRLPGQHESGERREPAEVDAASQAHGPSGAHGLERAEDAGQSGLRHLDG